MARQPAREQWAQNPSRRGFQQAGRMARQDVLKAERGKCGKYRRRLSLVNGTLVPQPKCLGGNSRFGICSLIFLLNFLDRSAPRGNDGCEGKGEFVSATPGPLIWHPYGRPGDGFFDNLSRFGQVIQLVKGQIPRWLRYSAQLSAVTSNGMNSLTSNSLRWNILRAFFR